MDTTDPDIEFDASGRCQYCRRQEVHVRYWDVAADEKKRRLDKLVGEMREAGKGRPYDCILGLSGGADSSYCVHIARETGLRALIVHMDNGWNSELAVKNIENLVRKSGFDYFNHVIDWPEFRDLQRAYILAGVVDVEVVTDHAILALIYRTAVKHRIKYVLSGENFATEGIMPRTWFYGNKYDIRNLRGIHARFGKVPIKTYPTMSLYEMTYFRESRDMRRARPLDCVDYTKKRAIEIMEREYGWRNYGGKHYESVFTKFYQAYMLPRKFGVDKRLPHLSNMVVSGQVTREEALEELKQPLYAEADLKQDYEYVTKKLGFTRDEFETILNADPVPHDAYPVETITSLQQLWIRAAKTWYRVTGS